LFISGKNHYSLTQKSCTRIRWRFKRRRNRQNVL
jgi:hypothetical protein